MQGSQGDDQRFPARQPRSGVRLAMWVHLPAHTEGTQARLHEHEARGRAEPGRVGTNQPHPCRRIERAVYLHRGSATTSAIRTVQRRPIHADNLPPIEGRGGATIQDVGSGRASAPEDILTSGEVRAGSSKAPMSEVTAARRREESSATDAARRRAMTDREEDAPLCRGPATRGARHDVSIDCVAPAASAAARQERQCRAAMSSPKGHR